MLFLSVMVFQKRLTHLLVWVTCDSLLRKGKNFAAQPHPPTNQVQTCILKYPWVKLWNDECLQKSPENRKFWSPARSQIFAMEKISSPRDPRERRKWSLSLGHNLKALGLTCVRSQSSREIDNAIISEFSTFLKINKSMEQFHIRLTLFYPIYG